MEALIKMTKEAKATIESKVEADFKQYVWKEAEKASELGLFVVSIYSMAPQDLQTRVIKAEGFDIYMQNFDTHGYMISWGNNPNHVLYKKSAEVYFEVSQKIWEAARDAGECGHFSCHVAFENNEWMETYEMVAESEGFKVECELHLPRIKISWDET